MFMRTLYLYNLSHKNGTVLSAPSLDPTVG